MRIVRFFQDLAADKKCTAGQIALAWLLHQSDDLVPIPSTRKTKYMDENADAAAVKLSPADLKEIDDFLTAHPVAGERALIN
jgi:aryl-alcohol dehydrogenase-like predicted oxidoreductase